MKRRTGQTRRLWGTGSWTNEDGDAIGGLMAVTGRFLQKSITDKSRYFDRGSLFSLKEYRGYMSN